MNQITCCLVNLVISNSIENEKLKSIHMCVCDKSQRSSVCLVCFILIEMVYSDEMVVIGQQLKSVAHYYICIMYDVRYGNDNKFTFNFQCVTCCGQSMKQLAAYRNDRRICCLGETRELMADRFLWYWSWVLPSLSILCSVVFIIEQSCFSSFSTWMYRVARIYRPSFELSESRF